MISDGSYSEFADQMIGDLMSGHRLHGGNFAYLLDSGDGRNAARVYRQASEFYGPFATAAAFALQCEWNADNDASAFVKKHQEWPPRPVAEELLYL